jgi:hypothetical protein
MRKMAKSIVSELSIAIVSSLMLVNIKNGRFWAFCAKKMAHVTLLKTKMAQPKPLRHRGFRAFVPLVTLLF